MVLFRFCFFSSLSAKQVVCNKPMLIFGSNNVNSSMIYLLMLCPKTKRLVGFKHTKMLAIVFSYVSICSYFVKVFNGNIVLSQLMNFLAHAFLSFNDPGLLVGNMIADSVKGKEADNYPDRIRQGILLHREIDSF